MNRYYKNSSYLQVFQYDSSPLLKDSLLAYNLSSGYPNISLLMSLLILAQRRQGSQNLLPRDYKAEVQKLAAMKEKARLNFQG